MKSLNQLHQLAKVKSNLWQLVDVLILGDMAPEEVAADLAANILTLHSIEDSLVNQFVTQDYKKIIEISEVKEVERTEKNLHSAK